MLIMNVLNAAETVDLKIIKMVEFQVVYTLPTTNIHGMIHLKSILHIYCLMIIKILGFVTTHTNLCCKQLIKQQVLTIYK